MSDQTPNDQHIDQDDDTEGHAYIPREERPGEDTEGHAFRAGKVSDAEADDDTEGHALKARG